MAKQLGIMRLGDKLVLSIVAIELKGSVFMLVGRAEGPIAAGSAEAVTIFGEDGTGICQIIERVEWPRISRGGTLTLSQPMRLDSVTGPDTVARWEYV